MAIGPLVLRHWRMLLMVALSAVVLSFLLSGPWCLTPRYRSTAIVYPANIESYAGENRSDQLLQLMESNSIRDSLIRRFGLAELYKVDTTERGGHAELYNKLARRISIRKTRYESVEVRVMDEDPRRARDMVRELLRQTDRLALRLHREKSAERLVIARNKAARNLVMLDSVDRLLDTLRLRGGMLDYGSQSEELMKGYMRLLAQGGGEAQKQEVRRLIDDLERHGGAFKGLTRLGDILRENHAGALLEREAALQDLSKELTYTNVVVHPEISDEPAHPIRWLVVLLSTLSALGIGLFLLLLRDRSAQRTHLV